MQTTATTAIFCNSSLIVLAASASQMLHIFSIKKFFQQQLAVVLISAHKFKLL